MKLTRRNLLRAGVASATGVGAAGCLGMGSPLDGSGDRSVYAAFFTIQDWAEHVARDQLEIRNPVSVGQMGHGWSPDGNVARDIASTRAFLYLDTPEFSWAQDVAAELERDYDDVVTHDLLEGISENLIGFDSGALPEFDRGHEYPRESLVLEEFDIYDLRSDDQLGYWHGGHWHGGVPDVPLNGTVPVGIVLLDDEDRVVPLGDGERYRVDARVAEGEPTDLLDIESHGRRVEFTGVETGTTAVVIEILEGDEVIHDTANDPARVNVVGDADGGASEFHDPHVWVDPVLGQEMVVGSATRSSSSTPRTPTPTRRTPTRTPTG